MYRVGIIGLGRKASTIDDEAHLRWLTNYDVTPSTHTSAYLANPKTEIVAVCARTQTTLDRFALKWKLNSVKGYLDYKKMLQHERLDIISIVTHSDLKSEIAIEAAKAGVKGIICEKAMATSLAEADEMLKSCQASNTKLLINHPRRYHPTFIRAKEIIRSGAIGVLKSMRGAIWTYLLHNGTHVWDMFRYFAGDVDWVIGGLGSDSPMDPGGYGLVHFKSGVLAFADCATMQGTNFQLYGENGDISVDMFADGFRLRIYEDAVKVAPERPMYQFRPKRLVEVKEIKNEPNFKPPMPAAIDDLMASIEENREPISNGQDGRAALEVGLAFHVSAQAESKKAYLPIKDMHLRVINR